MMVANPSETWEYFVTLVSKELGITLTDLNQDLLGEFPDPTRLEEFCKFYLNHSVLHPIWLASSLDQILGSLSLKFKNDDVTNEDLQLVKEVVTNACTNPWASSHLLCDPNDYTPDTDPGDYKVCQWLLNHSGLDMKRIQAQNDRLNDPSDYLE